MFTFVFYFRRIPLLMCYKSVLFATLVSGQLATLSSGLVWRSSGDAVGLYEAIWLVERPGGLPAWPWARGHHEAGSEADVARKKDVTNDDGCSRFAGRAVRQTCGPYPVCRSLVTLLHMKKGRYVMADLLGRPPTIMAKGRSNSHIDFLSSTTRSSLTRCPVPDLVWGGWGGAGAGVKYS